MPIPFKSESLPEYVVITDEIRDQVRLFKDDIGDVPEWRRRESLKAFPPPGMVEAMTDEEVARRLEPKAIRWPKGLIPGLRKNKSPETIFYYRFSTNKQEYSKEVQEHIIRRYYFERSQRVKLPPVSEYEFSDPETSGNRRLFERKQGGQMGRYLRPNDHLVVAYFDRLGRNSVDILSTMESLIRLGIHMHIVDLPWMQYANPDSPDTIRQVQGMASFVEFERRMCQKRTARTLDMCLDRGVGLGATVPYGYKVEKNPNWMSGVRDNINNPHQLVKADPLQIALLQEMYDKWATHGWSVCEIGNAVRNRGFKTPKGAQWDRQAVRDAIEHEHRRRCEAERHEPKPRLPEKENAMGNP